MVFLTLRTTHAHACWNSSVTHLPHQIKYQMTYLCMCAHVQRQRQKECNGLQEDNTRLVNETVALHAELAQLKAAGAGRAAELAAVSAGREDQQRSDIGRLQGCIHRQKLRLRAGRRFTHSLAHGAIAVVSRPSSLEDQVCAACAGSVTSRVTWEFPTQESLRSSTISIRASMHAPQAKQLRSRLSAAEGLMRFFVLQRRIAFDQEWRLKRRLRRRCDHVTAPEEAPAAAVAAIKEAQPGTPVVGKLPPAAAAIVLPDSLPGAPAVSLARSSRVNCPTRRLASPETCLISLQRQLHTQETRLQCWLGRLRSPS